MFHPEIHLDIPTGNLLAEVGLDPHSISEVIEHDRAMRCPDRDSVLCEAAPAEIFGPVLSRRQAGGS